MRHHKWSHPYVHGWTACSASLPYRLSLSWMKREHYSKMCQVSQDSRVRLTSSFKWYLNWGLFVFYLPLSSFMLLLIAFVCQGYRHIIKRKKCRRRRESGICRTNEKSITPGISSNCKQENLMKLIKNKVYYNTQRPLTHSKSYTSPSRTTNMKITWLASEGTASNCTQLYHPDMWPWYSTWHITVTHGDLHSL